MDEVIRERWASLDDGYPRGARFVPLIGEWVLWHPRGNLNLDGPDWPIARPRYGIVRAVLEPWYSWHDNVDIEVFGVRAGIHRVSSANLKAAQHHPRYSWVDDDEIGPMLLDICCALDGENWPCEAKRSHVSESEADRIERWRERRLEKDRQHW